jgi:hypothetical protein
MLYGIRGCSDPAVAYISSVTYWVFLCRDRNTTPAQGLEKWSYLGSAIQQSATTAGTIDQYISNLADRLKAKSPVLSRYSKMLLHEENRRVVLFADKTDSGIDNIQQISNYQDSPLGVSPADALQDLLSTGLQEADILAIAKPVRYGGQPFAVQMYCEIADQVFGWQAPTIEEEPLDVTGVAA